MLFFSKCLCGYKLLLLCFFIISSLHTSAASLKAAREEQGQAGFLGTSVPGGGLGLCWWCLQVELQDDQAAASLFPCWCHGLADSLQTGFLGIFPQRALILYLIPYATKVPGTGGQPEFFILWELGYNQSCVPLCALREPWQGLWWAIF